MELNQKQYIESKKEFNQIFLSYIEEDDQNQDNQSIFEYIDSVKIRNNKLELEEILYTIQNISDNHKRNTNFIEKIEKIFQALSDTIRQTFSSVEVFEIFKHNKLILLLLLKNQLITFDNDNILNYIKNDEIYSQYFYPEIKSKLSQYEINKIESQLQSNGQNIFDNFDEYRSKGENDSYICSLIRQDSVEEFITYVTQKNISLSMKINHSIFETNRLLIDKRPSLIKYAAFYGSIQIYRYLKNSNVDLKSSLWLYAIHSQNAELIHEFERNEIDLKKRSYIEFFEEAIKCHHNDIADYIQDNLIDVEITKSQEFKDKTSEFSIKYHNYHFITDEIDLDSNFFYLNQYHYPEFVSVCVKDRRNYIESIIIQKQYFNEIPKKKI